MLYTLTFHPVYRQYNAKEQFQDRWSWCHASWDIWVRLINFKMANDARITSFAFFKPSRIRLEQSRQLYSIRTSTALQCTSPKPRVKYDTAVCNNTIYRAFNYSTAIIKVLLFEPGASIYTSVPRAVPPRLSYGPHPAHRSLGLTSSDVHNASVPEPGILIATISHLIKNTQLFHNDL